MVYASLPSASFAAADVITAIFGHWVTFQSSSHLFGVGFLPVAAAKLVYNYV